MKKRIVFIIIILFLIASNILSTPQRGDLLIWENITYRLTPFPLELLPGFNKIRETLFGKHKCCDNTNCGRMYQAKWEIIERDLFLTEVYSCCFQEDGIKADLKSLASDFDLTDYYKNGRIKANWVNGFFWISEGKVIYNDHGTGPIYEKDICLTIEKGQIKKTETYNNSLKSIRSEFTENESVLHKFIYSNINWKKIPDLKDNIVKVFVSFNIYKPGQLKNIKIHRGAGGIFDIEALRVISLIPEWSIYFTNGEYVASTWTIPVFFSEENRKKYAN